MSISDSSAPQKEMTADVLVPSYRRPADLKRCLEALALQDRAPDGVVVVVRENDSETRGFLAKLHFPTLKVRVIVVTEPGVVHALNEGLAAIAADVIAITDDDAAPHPEWLKSIVETFAADPLIGGVGGRDRMFVGGKLLQGRKRRVGIVPRLGPHVGNHHIGYGRPRDVDVLKGVNCAYRRVAIADIGFDKRMRGTGAQVNWEISLGLSVKRQGWKLIYDPSILVDHYPAARFDEDQRESFNALAMENAAFNEMIARMEARSMVASAALLAWAILIGTREAPGLLQWLRFVAKDGSLAGAKSRSAILGKVKAWQCLRADRPC